MALDNLSAKEIADQLNRSVFTVQDEIKTMKNTLGRYKQSELVKYYYQQRFNFKKLKPIWRITAVVTGLTVAILGSYFLSNSGVLNTVYDSIKCSLENILQK